jgi:hypothetical protein
VNWKLFALGWRRRSAMILDNAGCPPWLVKLRCPVLPGWGRELRLTCRRVFWYEWGEDDEKTEEETRGAGGDRDQEETAQRAIK